MQSAPFAGFDARMFAPRPAAAPAGEPRPGGIWRRPGNTVPALPGAWHLAPAERPRRGFRLPRLSPALAGEFRGRWKAPAGPEPPSFAPIGIARAKRGPAAGPSVAWARMAADSPPRIAARAPREAARPPRAVAWPVCREIPDASAAPAVRRAVAAIPASPPVAAPHEQGRRIERLAPPGPPRTPEKASAGLVPAAARRRPAAPSKPAAAAVRDSAAPLSPAVRARTADIPEAAPYRFPEAAASSLRVIPCLAGRHGQETAPEPLAAPPAVLSPALPVPRLGGELPAPGRRATPWQPVPETPSAAACRMAALPGALPGLAAPRPEAVGFATRAPGPHAPGSANPRQEARPAARCPSIGPPRVELPPAMEAACPTTGPAGFDARRAAAPLCPDPAAARPAVEAGAVPRPALAGSAPGRRLSQRAAAPPPGRPADAAIPAPARTSPPGLPASRIQVRDLAPGPLAGLVPLDLPWRRSPRSWMRGGQWRRPALRPTAGMLSLALAQLKENGSSS